MTDRLSALQPPPARRLTDLLNLPVWIAWAGASLFLVAWAAYYAFLSIAFTGYSLRAHVQPSFAEYARSALPGSAPLLCALVLAAAGIVLWRKPRYRVAGLCVILFELALAVCFYVYPVGLLYFIDLL